MPDDSEGMPDDYRCQMTMGSFANLTCCQEKGHLHIFTTEAASTTTTTTTTTKDEGSAEKLVRIRRAQWYTVATPRRAWWTGQRPVDRLPLLHAELRIYYRLSGVRYTPHK